MHARPFPSTLYLLLGFFAACGGGASTTPPAKGPASSSDHPAPTPSDPFGGHAIPRVRDVRCRSRGRRSADRTEDDRLIDFGRHPAETLAFFRVAPGQRVVDLAAAGGYTTELLARAVGPTGKVYGQNSKWLLENFAEIPFSRRLARTVMHNVVRVE